MKTSTRILILILLTGITAAAFGQIEDKIYGINNESSGVFKFAEVDLNTGILTNLSDLPMTSYSFNTSSAYNTIQDFYYLCTEQQILVINPTTGTLLETIDIPFPNGGNLLHAHYDLCDRVLYGIVNNYPTEIYFAKYDFGENQIYNLMEMDPNSYFCGGCQSVIDYENRIYYYKSGNPSNNFIGIDLDSYEIVSDPTVVNITGESFGHIDLFCGDNEIYGTSANVDELVKSLATVDKSDGMVEYTSDLNWDLGVWKPMAGGSCIDQNEGVFYYSGAGSIIVSVDIETSEANSIDLGTGEFLFMEHFSECECLEQVSVPEKESLKLDIFPNPFTDKINIQNATESMILLVFDHFGKMVSTANFDSVNTEVDLSRLSSGSYYYNIIRDYELVTYGHFIKN